MLKGIFKKNKEFEDYKPYEEEKEDKSINKDKKTKKIINIVFIILIIIMVLITIDVISVSRYNVGPFFAVRTKVYNDGGSKEYYGIGYKVIKYNQTEGRRDTEIGLWSMSYSVTPTELDVLDLAIEFRNKPVETTEKFGGQFLSISGNIYKVDEKNKQITLRYTDPDEKYTFDVICTMAEKISYDKYKKGNDTTVIGTASEFSVKDKKNPSNVKLSDCFIK